MMIARPDFITGVCGGLLVIVFLLLVHIYRYRTLLQTLITPKSRFLLIGYHPVKKAVKYLLFFVGILSLMVALLRPQIEENPISVKEEGWNIIFALDVSRSMRATDVEPSRLSFSKAKIKTLVQELACAQLGLVLFSEDAFVQCPITPDKEAFFLFLDQVDSETISGGSTALDRALSVSVEALEEVKNASKIIILLTDGEDFSRNLEVVKQKMKTQQIAVSILGVGTIAGAPIPIIDETGVIVGYEKEDSGSVAISRLDESVLFSLSRDVGGMYAKMDMHHEDVDHIKQYISAQKKGAMDEKTISINTDLYPFFLFGGVACLLLEWFL